MKNDLCHFELFVVSFHVCFCVSLEEALKEENKIENQSKKIYSHSHSKKIKLATKFH